MHHIKRQRLSERKPFITACIAAWLSSIALLLRGDKVGITVGFFLIGLGILGCILIMFIPLGKEKGDLDYAIKKSRVIWGLWFEGPWKKEITREQNAVLTVKETH